MAQDTEIDAHLEANWLSDIEGAIEIAEVEGGEPLSLTPDFSEVIAKARTVFTVSEIAQIAGVKDRQVHHWTAGEHSPQGAARDRLLQLFQIVSNLETHLNAQRIKVWMWSPHSDLSGAPIDCLRGGEGAAVLAVAKALALREEVSDLSLVELARFGNPSAYDGLVRRYRGFIRLKAASYVCLGSNVDDLVQEGLLGLYKAVRDFSSGNDAEFREFASRCITRQIVTAAKTHRRSELWHPLPSYLAGLQAHNQSAAAAESPNAAEASRAIDELVSRLSSENFPEFERQALTLYLDGFGLAQIAAELECDIESVSTALNDVKQSIGNAAAKWSSRTR